MTDAAPRTVVLTRQPAQAGALEAGLAAAGLPVAYLPLTDFVLPPDEGRLRACVARLGGRTPVPAWLVLTSPNAVRALALCGWEGHVAPGVRVAVTGPGTARVLARAGYPGTPWMPVGDASAAGIVAQFPAPGQAAAPGPGSRTVLLPQSSRATAEVAEGIAGRGWDVERLEAYRTVPFPAGPGLRLLSVETDRGGGGPAGSGAGGDGGGGHPGASGVLTPEDLAGTDVVLTSPSAVAELVARRGTARPPRTRFFAIGRPTRDAAVALGLVPDGTAASPDAAGLLAVLDPAGVRSGSGPA